MMGHQILNEIAAVMGGQVSGSRAIFPTPGHGKNDRGSWASLVPGAPDGVLIHSENGGDPLAIKDELRRKGVLAPFEPGQAQPSARKVRTAGTSIFKFKNADGVTVCRKLRTDRQDGSKTFAWEHPDGAGGWRMGRGCDALFYRLPELLSAQPDAVVYMAEGEKKADLLAKWGLVATSSKDLPEDLSPLAGRSVVILPDNDSAGEKIANTLRDRLDGVAERVAVLALPGLPQSGDIIDWSGNGRSAFELLQLTEKAFVVGEDEFVPLDLIALAATTPTAKPFAIAQLAPLGEVTLFTGPGSGGKSLLAQQLATCSAAAIDCLRLAVLPGPAIYVTCEDDADQLHWRQAHLCEELGAPMASLAGLLHLVSLRGALDNELCKFAADGTLTVAPAYHRLVRLINRTRSGLVFLDNVAHLFTGNENDRGEVTRFINLLNRLAGETGAAIILLGHPNKAGDNYSGSTAWLNAVRSQFTIEHDVETDLRTITVGKANYARKGNSIRFIWRNWAFVHEDDLTPDNARDLAQTVMAGADNKLFLACLKERAKQRRAVSEKRGPTFAPVQFATMPESKGIGKKRLEQAMDRLFRIEAIERAELWKGPDRKPVFGLRDTAGDAAGNTEETA